MIYLITFDLDGKRKNENFEADNPGKAFALCLKKYPDAQLRDAETEARIDKKKFGVIHYEPPPIQRQPVNIRTGPRKPRKNEPCGNFE